MCPTSRFIACATAADKQDKTVITLVQLDETAITLVQLDKTATTSVQLDKLLLNW